MYRAWTVVLVACGGSAPPASAPHNTPPPSPTAAAPAIEPEVIETKQPDPNDPALARQQAIEQARDAGILGSGPPLPAPDGPLDKTSIRREIRAHLKPIQYCYEKQLLDRPALTGTTLVQFLIATDGHVETSVGSGFDPKVDTCVADAVKRIMFPKPDAGGTMQVNYPFTFRPAS